MHDRLDSLITEESCQAEIESFAKHGQLIPVLGRPLPPDSTHKFELICGARRLFVARHINVPLLMELCEMSDRQAIIAMDIENRQRADISPYERGLGFARLLREGYFSSQQDIAQALRISKSQVSRLLKLAQLPPVIVNAFDSPKAIYEGWGVDFMQALENPARRPALIRAARTIGGLSQRPPAPEVYRLLLSPATNGRRLRRAGHDQVIKDGSGKPIFRIRQQRSAIAFLIPIEKAAPEVFASLRLAIEQILLAGVTQTLAGDPITRRIATSAFESAPPPPTCNG
jgi:ParB family chromosome partitioning protein